MLATVRLFKIETVMRPTLPVQEQSYVASDGSFSQPTHADGLIRGVGHKSYRKCQIPALIDYAFPKSDMDRYGYDD